MATINVKDAAGATVAIEKPLAPGSAAAASSRPVAFSTEDIARLGIITEAAPASDTASSGLNGRLQRVAQNVTSTLALFGAVNETAPVSDTASSGLNGRLQRIAQRLTSLLILPASLGGKTAAASLAVTTATDDPPLALLGALTEAAPASDTASSGLNGRAQRIAQRLTSLIALLPASLGIKTAAASLSITHASDDSVVAATGAIGDTAYTGTGNSTIIAALKALVARMKPIRVTYRTTVFDGTLAATATDFFLIQGSASKTIEIVRVRFSCKATAATNVEIYLAKHSAANTGGTSAASTIVVNDSADAAATATTKVYSANPTIGGLVGYIGTANIMAAITGAGATPATQKDWAFGDSAAGAKGIILNGTAQELALSFAGQTVPAGFKYYLELEWLEY